MILFPIKCISVHVRTIYIPKFSEETLGKKIPNFWGKGCFFQDGIDVIGLENAQIILCVILNLRKFIMYIQECVLYSGCLPFHPPPPPVFCF